jgi:hypothetical protein
MPNSQPKEKLTFKIGLSAVFWDKFPEYSILLNDVLIERNFIKFDIDPGGEQKVSPIKYIEFAAELEEDSKNRLQIRLENKEDNDTIENDDKTAIIKDLLLNINSIEIDDISLEQLMWDSSEFVADDPARPVLKQCVNLGWNGTYILEFTSPFYLWLLENI